MCTANGYIHIDPNYIKEISDNSTDLMRELINLFIQQVPTFELQMDELLSSKQYTLLGKLAHKVKNSVAMMGIDELTKDMKTLETLAQKEQEVNLYPILVKRFKDISRMSIVELNKLLATL